MFASITAYLFFYFKNNNEILHKNRFIKTLQLNVSKIEIV